MMCDWLPNNTCHLSCPEYDAQLKNALRGGLKEGLIHAPIHGLQEVLLRVVRRQAADLDESVEIP